jgi:hypothetical protein
VWKHQRKERGDKPTIQYPSLDVEPSNPHEQHFPHVADVKHLAVEQTRDGREGFLLHFWMFAVEGVVDQRGDVCALRMNRGAAQRYMAMNNKGSGNFR